MRGPGESYSDVIIRPGEGSTLAMRPLRKKHVTEAAGLANNEVAIDLERHHDAAALNTMPERFHAFASRRMTSL